MINKATIILLLCTLQFSLMAQQRYQLDTKKSKIFWKIETVGKHNGHLLFNSGKLDYSPQGQPSTGYFIMDMKSIRSTDRPTAEGREKIDLEIRKFDFFDVARYPTAIMNVKRIDYTVNPGIYKVTGNLTIKGITKPIEFLATIKKTETSINVTANFKIDRTNWNIYHNPEPKPIDFFSVVKDKIITNDISISLNLTFNK